MAFRFSRLLAVQCVGLAALAAVTPAIASRSHRVVFAKHLKFASHIRHKAVPAHVVVGQRGIDTDRTRAIQTALIDKSYLTGEPTGEWDATTEAAMQKFQGDNGWQTKLMPDSRALIKLGLGPNGTAGNAEAAAPKAALEQATGPDTLAAVHSILN